MAFWAAMRCISKRTQRFGGMYCFHLQGWRVRQERNWALSPNLEPSNTIEAEIHVLRAHCTARVTCKPVRIWGRVGLIAAFPYCVLQSACRRGTFPWTSKAQIIKVSSIKPWNGPRILFTEHKNSENNSLDASHWLRQFRLPPPTSIKSPLYTKFTLRVPFNWIKIACRH
jgi:hypothetical protein